MAGADPSSPMAWGLAEMTLADAERGSIEV